MMQATLQSCSLNKWFVSMAYPKQLCLIGILSSLAIFGGPCDLGLELNFLFLLLVTLKLMDKHR